MSSSHQPPGGASADAPSFSFLVIGDLHFRTANARQTTFFEKWLLSHLETNGASIDAVVILGDLLDRFTVDAWDRLMRMLTKIHSVLEATDTALWIIIGNHDRPHRRVFLTPEHPFTSLERWPNTIVVDRPIPVQLEGTGGDIFNVLLMPYVFPGRFQEAIRTTLASSTSSESYESILSRYDVLFAHQEFYGAAYGPTPSRDGDVYPLTAPPCISGHIHVRSSPQPNIIYPGIPYPHGWTTATPSTVPPVVGGVATLQFHRSGGGGSGWTLHHPISYHPLPSLIHQVMVHCSNLSEFQKLVTTHIPLDTSADMIPAILVRSITTHSSDLSSISKLRIVIDCESVSAYHAVCVMHVPPLIRNNPSIEIRPSFTKQPSNTVATQIINPLPIQKRRPFLSYVDEELQKTSDVTARDAMRQWLGGMFPQLLLNKGGGGRG